MKYLTKLNKLPRKDNLRISSNQIIATIVFYNTQGEQTDLINIKNDFTNGKPLNLKLQINEFITSILINCDCIADFFGLEYMIIEKFGKTLKIILC